MNITITNEFVSEYLRDFYRPVSDSLYALRLKAEQDGVPVILRETEEFLCFMMKVLHPETVLEIGTAVGYSSMVFASMGASVVTVEKDEKMAEKAAGNFELMGFSHKIRLLKGDGEEVAALCEILEIKSLKEKENGLSFDMVFIDAAKSHYKRFLDAALPLCRPGAVIISDNVLLKGTTASDSLDPNRRFKTNIKRMREYLTYISDHPRLDTAIIACGDGLALSRYDL